MEELKNPPPPIVIGKRIRAARKLTKVSQEALASSVNVNRSYLSLVENGKSSPTFEFLDKISRGLHMRVEEIILGKDAFRYFTLDAEEGYLYSGLADFLGDREQMLLMNPSEAEVECLKGIRLHPNHNPSKRFFIEALLDMRKARGEGRAGKKTE